MPLFPSAAGWQAFYETYLKLRHDGHALTAIEIEEDAINAGLSAERERFMKETEPARRRLVEIAARRLPRTILVRSHSGFDVVSDQPPVRGPV